MKKTDKTIYQKPQTKWTAVASAAELLSASLTGNLSGNPTEADDDNEGLSGDANIHTSWEEDDEALSPTIRPFQAY